MSDGTTILAVDDTPALLALLVRILSHAGYHVRPADNGDLALAAVAADAPDLILLDVRMKGMDGLEVCRRLKAREETRHIPVILISAFADESEWVEGLQQGAADFITKPFQAEELLCRVRTQLDLRRARLSLERQSEVLRETNQELLREIARGQHMENDLRLSLEQTERSRQEMLRTLEDQKEAEGALRESEARCRDIFERSTIGQSMTGFDGKLLKVNRAFADMLGQSVEELQKITLADITHPDNLAESWECVRALLTSLDFHGGQLT
jgi:DNA-binding response OmpR family regulator